MTYKSAQDHSSLKIREKLKVRRNKATNEFAANHPHAKSFLDEAGIDLGRVREHAARVLAAGTIGSAILLSPGPSHTNYADYDTHYAPESLTNVLASPASALLEEPQSWLVTSLNTLLPVKSRPLAPLSAQEEKLLGKVITKSTKVPAVPVLEGERLNHVYGFIGAEQHLPRFAGDTISKHDELQGAGITRNRGAFGYFASKDGLTKEDIEREKYYVAVQTFYLPNWSKRAKHLKDWYKWRKVIVVNADNGNAVVAVVGDAGPAAWTGKQFGGSPEVMYELGSKRYKKGRVLLYFVDDPENKIPLGPVKYQVPDVLVIPTPLFEENERHMQKTT